MMKAVRFHNSVNQSIGNNTIALPAKRKRKKKGKKVESVYDIARELSKAAGVYESFKDESQHKKIIDVCANNGASVLVKSALKSILEKEDDCTVQEGLSELLLEDPPAPFWKDLSKNAQQSLRAIASSFPELVKKSASSIATTSSSATIHTANTGNFDGALTVEDVLPAAFQAMIGAAWKTAIERGLDDGMVKEEFDRLFWTESTQYREAYEAVVSKERREKPISMSNKVWNQIEKAIVIVNRIDVASQGRADSTEQSNFDHLYMAALKAFSNLVDEVGFSDDKEKVGDLLNLVVQPTTPTF